MQCRAPFPLAEEMHTSGAILRVFNHNLYWLWFRQKDAMLKYIIHSELMTQFIVGVGTFNLKHDECHNLKMMVKGLKPDM